MSAFFPPMSCAHFSPHTRLTGWKGSQEEALSRRETTGCCIEGEGAGGEAAMSRREIMGCYVEGEGAGGRLTGW